MTSVSSVSPKSDEKRTSENTTTAKRLKINENESGSGDIQANLMPLIHAFPENKSIILTNCQIYINNE